MVRVIDDYEIYRLRRMNEEPKAEDQINEMKLLSLYLSVPLLSFALCCRVANAEKTNSIIIDSVSIKNSSVDVDPSNSIERTEEDFNKVPCVNITISECFLKANKTLSIACDAWTLDDGCYQNLTLRYVIANILEPAGSVKILEGFGPLLNVSLLGIDSNEDNGLKLLSRTISSKELIKETYDMDQLNVCMLGSAIGINITKASLGVENRSDIICESASDTILITKESPSSAPTPTLYKSSKSSKGSESQQPSGAYYKYVCPSKSAKGQKSNGTRHRPDVVPSFSPAPSSVASTRFIPTTPYPSSTSRKVVKNSNGDIGRTSNICAECVKMMSKDLNAPMGSLKETIYYIVRIFTKHNRYSVKDSEMKEALLEIMNGFFKAELIGCNSLSRRRMTISAELILYSAEFNDLSFDGKETSNLCSSTEWNCHGAQGDIEVTYNGGNDELRYKKDEVERHVTKLLQSKAEAISEMMEDVDTLEFVIITQDQNAIKSSRSDSKLAWIITPLIVATLLILAGVFVIMRDQLSHSYMHLDDGMDQGIFGLDQKVQSDADIKFPIRLVSTGGDKDESLHESKM